MIPFMISFALAKSPSVETVLKKNKVKLLKTEIVGGVMNYDVELAYDPMIGNNTVKLESEIADANGCKSFVLVSKLDEVKVVVTATKAKKKCSLNEDIEKMESK